jgi:hypothetical protein
MRQANKPTLATKKPSATETKLRSSPQLVEGTLLSPIKEENKDDDFSTLPEVPGSTDTQRPTGDDLMEPLKVTSCIADTQRRLEKENQEERRYYEQSINAMRAEMNAMREDYNDLQRSRSSSVAENPTQKHAFETPKVQRPQDKAYQEILTASKHQFQQEEPKQQSFRNHANENEQQNEMMKIYDICMNNLMNSMGHILKYSKKEDTTELPKFQGGDSQWPKRYQPLRAYLQARGWLPTFDHPIGPSTNGRPTPDFDTDINSLIYQKLQATCFEGTASTYVRMEAEFDGHGAGTHLKKRHNNSSPQQLESYILLAKGHRHTSGTSMPLRIDQFKAILGYMPDCGKIPTNTERIDWFLPTVTEEIYASAKAMCLTQKIQGTLEWGDMVLLFNHTCFARYPHFQIAELQTGKKLSQNSVNSHITKCALHPDGNHTTADCKKLRQLQLNPTQDKGGRRGRKFQRERKRKPTISLAR